MIINGRCILWSKDENTHSHAAFLFEPWNTSLQKKAVANICMTTPCPHHSDDRLAVFWWCSAIDCNLSTNEWIHFIFHNKARVPRIMSKPLLPSQAPSYVDLRSDDSMSNQCSDLRSAGKVKLYFFWFHQCFFEMHMVWTDELHNALVCHTSILKYPVFSAFQQQRPWHGAQWWWSSAVSCGLRRLGGMWGDGWHPWFHCFVLSHFLWPLLHLVQLVRMTPLDPSLCFGRSGSGCGWHCGVESFLNDSSRLTVSVNPHQVFGQSMTCTCVCAYVEQIEEDISHWHLEATVWMFECQRI